MKVYILLPWCHIVLLPQCLISIVLQRCQTPNHPDSALCTKNKQKSMWEVKKISRFLSTNHGIPPAARRMKLWSLNANLLFEEPHQLTKFAQQVHLNHIWQRKLPFKALICNILGLAATVVFKANKARFTQIQVFFPACSLQNEDDDPPIFFYICDNANSSPFDGKIFRKKINVRTD